MKNWWIKSKELPTGADCCCGCLGINAGGIGTLTLGRFVRPPVNSWIKASKSTAVGGRGGRVGLWVTTAGGAAVVVGCTLDRIRIGCCCCCCCCWLDEALDRLKDCGGEEATEPTELPGVFRAGKDENRLPPPTLPLLLRTGARVGAGLDGVGCRRGWSNCGLAAVKAFKASKGSGDPLLGNGRRDRGRVFKDEDEDAEGTLRGRSGSRVRDRVPDGITRRGGRVGAWVVTTGTTGRGAPKSVWKLSAKATWNWGRDVVVGTGGAGLRLGGCCCCCCWVLMIRKFCPRFWLGAVRMGALLPRDCWLLLLSEFVRARLLTKNCCFMSSSSCCKSKSACSSSVMLLNTGGGIMIPSGKSPWGWKTHHVRAVFNHF